MIMIVCSILLNLYQQSKNLFLKLFKRKAIWCVNIVILLFAFKISKIKLSAVIKFSNNFQHLFVGCH